MYFSLLQFSNYRLDIIRITELHIKNVRNIREYAQPSAGNLTLYQNSTPKNCGTLGTFLSEKMRGVIFGSIIIWGVVFCHLLESVV